MNNQMNGQTIYQQSAICPVQELYLNSKIVRVDSWLKSKWLKIYICAIGFILIALGSFCLASLPIFTLEFGSGLKIFGGINIGVSLIFLGFAITGERLVSEDLVEISNPEHREMLQWGEAFPECSQYLKALHLRSPHTWCFLDYKMMRNWVTKSEACDVYNLVNQQS